MVSHSKERVEQNYEKEREILFRDGRVKVMGGYYLDVRDRP